jgi:hypothetical protein
MEPGSLFTSRAAKVKGSALPLNIGLEGEGRERQAPGGRQTSVHQQEAVRGEVHSNHLRNRLSTVCPPLMVTKVWMLQPRETTSHQWHLSTSTGPWNLFMPCVQPSEHVLSTWHSWRCVGHSCYLQGAYAPMGAGDNVLRRKTWAFGLARLWFECQLFQCPVWSPGQVTCPPRFLMD